MTVKEATEKGYKELFRSRQRGYVSRKIDIDTQPVLSAGGSRKGKLYYLAPCFDSTQYCFRVYIGFSERKTAAIKHLERHGYRIDSTISGCDGGGVMYKNDEGDYAYLTDDSVSYGESPKEAIIDHNTVWYF